MRREIRLKNTLLLEELCPEIIPDVVVSHTVRGIRLFLFDVDGTLVKTGGAGLRALQSAFQELYGLDDVLDSFDPAGKTDPGIFRDLVQRHFNRGLQENESGRIAHHYLRYLSLEMHKLRALQPLPGVDSLIRYLMTRGDILLGLGTGNLERGARLKLLPTQLNPCFPFGGFGSDAEQRHEILRIGHRRAEVRCGEMIARDNVYILGDTPLDIEAAHRAGYQAVGVASGTLSEMELREFRPQYLLKDMTEGLDFVKALDASLPPMIV